MQEKGFYHHSRGYWQVIGEVTEETLASFPSGTVEVPLKPSGNCEWAGSEWIELPADLAQLSGEARSQRNGLLQQSDWTQVADAPVDQAAWATYRQALRDITTQEGFPEQIIWPTPPS